MVNIPYMEHMGMIEYDMVEYILFKCSIGSIRGVRVV